MLFLTLSLYDFLKDVVLGMFFISMFSWFHSLIPFSIILLFDIVSLGVPITFHVIPYFVSLAVSLL